VTRGDRSPTELLEVALAHLEIAQRHAELDLDAQVVTDAIALRLAAAVEAIGRLDAGLRDQVADDHWERMRGMRNRIAHGYASVSVSMVRATVERELAPLVSRINALLAELDRT
jgi:uncharacterized protein with HEPN domain